jgi:hypothetical protein
MERKAHNSLNEAALQVQLDEAGLIGGPKVKRTVNQQQQGVISKHKKNLSTTQANLDRSGVPANAPIRQKVRDTAASKMSTAASKIRLDAVQWDELDIPDMVLEYFSNYFGDNLNEDTSDEDIMEAVYDLIDLTESVLDVVQLDEKGVKRAITQQQQTAIRPALNLAVMQGSLKQGSGGVLRPREGGSFDPHLTGDLEGSAGRSAIRKMKSARAKIAYKDRTSGERHKRWTTGVENDVVAGKLTGRQGKEKVDRSIRTRVSPETVARTQRHINPQIDQGATNLTDLTPNKDYIKSAKARRDAHKAEMAKSD